MPGPHVDVNMHPTKRGVGFLHQEALIDALRTAIEEKLLASNDRCWTHFVMCAVIRASQPASGHPCYLLVMSSCCCTIQETSGQQASMLGRGGASMR